MLKKFLVWFAILLLVSVSLLLWYFSPWKEYQASDFGIVDLKSTKDYDNDGIDDYTDVLEGARLDAKNHPRYDGSYVDGGYPSDDVGVCADTIWRAFKNAGYSLKDMIDEDIKNNKHDYTGLGGRADPNIDFRRVRNLKVFFDKYATNLTLDPYDISNWNPGDIVIFGKNYTHIAIISDKRNKQGLPYLIHNAGQQNREENAMLIWYLKDGIYGHYRWDGGYYDSIW